MSHCVEKESLISSAASSNRKQTFTCSHRFAVDLQLSPNWNQDVVPIYLRLTTFFCVFNLLGNFLPVACSAMSVFVCSQTSSEAVLLAHSGGTWGHKRDAVLQHDRGRLPV